MEKETGLNLKGRVGLRLAEGWGRRVLSAGAQQEQRQGSTWREPASGPAEAYGAREEVREQGLRRGAEAGSLRNLDLSPERWEITKVFSNQVTWKDLPFMKMVLATGRGWTMRQAEWKAGR